MEKLGKWLSSKGKRVCAAVLCCSIILCNVANGAIASARNKGDVTEFRLHRASLNQELEKTVNKGKTVEKEFEFEGSSAGEYEELLAADGNLYELKLSSKKTDGVKLQIFARLGEEPDPEETYMVDGSEEIIFLLTNTTDKVKNAVIRIGDQKTEPIRVAPRKAVQTSSSA
ncbi:MAG: hypothetical protein Q4E91_14350, partial [Lachnospiraceae bacterium]|nr:hypothetical protein [Lachnospiraceae bacterium]